MLCPAIRSFKLLTNTRIMLQNSLLLFITIGDGKTQNLQGYKTFGLPKIGLLSSFYFQHCRDKSYTIRWQIRT